MSNVQQKLEDEITCPVCQDTFDKPKILPCGHYYCKRCVLQLAAREQPFPCPECRRDTHLPPGPTGVDEFPTAFFVNRMKSLHDDLDHVESPDLKVKSRVTSSLYDNASPLLAARAEKNTTRADQQSWFFGVISRKEAEKMLNLPINQYGSFLIRNSESTPGKYSLSVRNNNMETRHYLVDRMDSGRLFIYAHTTFPDLQSLVSHYQQNADGLCCKLMYPCRKVQTAEFPKPRASNEQLEIERASITCTKHLGTGQFWVVQEGLWKGKTPVAIKVLKPGTLSMSDFHQELKIMRNLRHPKLIELYAVCTKEEPILVVTELMANGSLLEYLRGKGRSLNLQQLIDLSAQVAIGMTYLEDQKCIHRNLAARNILLGQDLVCKISIFNISAVDDSGIYKIPSSKPIFPIKWVAPETAQHYHFTTKSNVWTFGIVLYEIITYGGFPYPALTNHEAVERMRGGYWYRMPCPKGCPDKLYNIMKDTWHEKPASRPTFKTLRRQLKELLEDQDDYCNT